MASEGKSVPSRARDGVGAKDTSLNNSNQENWTLPSQHGENGTPWYDLPAACWLPSIDALVDYRKKHPRRRRKGMDPRNVKPLRFDPGPVNPRLTRAVQQLIKDAGSIYDFSLDDTENTKSDYDRMGQKLLIRRMKNENGGQKLRLVTGDTYYGWTRDFAEKMFKARKSARDEARERARRKDSEPSEPSDSSRSPSPEAAATLKRKWDDKGSSPPPRAPTGPRRNSLSSSSRPNSSEGRYEPLQPQFNNAFTPTPAMQQPYQGYPTPPPPPHGLNGYQAPPPPPPTGWQAPWPPAPPPPNYQQPQQFPQYQQFQAPLLQGYMQQQPPQAGYTQQAPPPPPPPFQSYQQLWTQQAQPGQPQMSQFPQPYAAPNQGQPAWQSSAPRGGPQTGFRGRGRGGNRGGYGYGRGY